MLIPDKITGSTYTAAEFTEFKNEIQNLILSTGLSLASNSNQNKEAVKRYALAGNFYIDSGAADTYVLSKVGSYATTAAYIQGMQFIFVANATCTGASTVNISGLGAIALKKDYWTNDLDAGDITVGKLYMGIYDSSSGFAELIPLRGVDDIGTTITFVDTNVVNNQPLPAAWTNLDLSSVVGANTALVMVRVLSITIGCEVGLRTDGDTDDVSVDTGVASSLGGGVTAGNTGIGNQVYFIVKTSSSGIIEINKQTAGTNYSLDVVAFIK